MTTLEKEMFLDLMAYVNSLLNTCESCDSDDVFDNDDYQIIGKVRYIMRHCEKTLGGVIPCDIPIL